MKLLLGIVIASLLVFAGCSSTSYNQEEVKEFATCLTAEGAVMYGAFWCPHCAKTKKKFGASFSEINYVECDPRGDDEQAELCIEKEIEAYDTWEFVDGSRVVGEPSFEVLSEKTGCVLPGVN